MKKIFVIGLMVIMMVCFVSCATSKMSPYEKADKLVEEIKEEKHRVKIEGKYGDLRPNWVMEDPTNDEVLFGVGYARVSNEDDSRKLAKVEARNELAEKVFILVHEKIDTTKVNGKNSYDIMASQVAQAYLSGEAVEDEWVSMEGTVYVLMSVPVSYVKDQMTVNRGDLDNYIKNDGNKTLMDVFMEQVTSK